MIAYHITYQNSSITFNSYSNNWTSKLAIFQLQFTLSFAVQLLVAVNLERIVLPLFFQFNCNQNFELQPEDLVEFHYSPFIVSLSLL